jgi:hypothetical protein
MTAKQSSGGASGYCERVCSQDRSTTTSVEPRNLRKIGQLNVLYYRYVVVGKGIVFENCRLTVRVVYRFVFLVISRKNPY